ncbi:calcium calmodulin-dependent protein kinase 1 [Nannochloropsis gaditana]|uniref:Calcium calmodulin-dependent protein kinase 1 n=1 Tax=Nannochloropsis gaditana TaxID=72520 RepID=W7TGE4_9STRA|nr:calcium calmodulin-dependent protein kinase 1 [Nannochloropsis gaditana]
MTSNGEPFKLLPLLTIQHTIAHSIELAHRACEHSPQDAHDVKRSAILCRAQLIYTIKLLKKIEQTAASVLEMFPDLELAIEDDEPSLAHDFFETVRKRACSSCTTS